MGQGRRLELCRQCRQERYVKKCGGEMVDGGMGGKKEWEGTVMLKIMEGPRALGR